MDIIGATFRFTLASTSNGQAVLSTIGKHFLSRQNPTPFRRNGR
jgi:hypothetical protein